VIFAGGSLAARRVLRALDVAATRVVCVNFILFSAKLIVRRRQ